MKCDDCDWCEENEIGCDYCYWRNANYECARAFYWERLNRVCIWRERDQTVADRLEAQAREIDLICSERFGEGWADPF